MSKSKAISIRRLDYATLPGDCVFQLNALLWMLTPRPAGEGVVPLLYRAGFELAAINPDISLDPGVVAKTGERSIATNKQCCPEVAIRRRADRRAALVECKRSSFGVESDNCHQARAMLLATAHKETSLARLGPLSQCRLIFLVSHPHGDPMRETLDALTAELSGVGFPMPRAHAGDFEHRGTSIGLTLDQASSQYLGLQDGWSTFLECDAENDPRPLYFIPLEVDSNANDDYGRKMLLERFRATLVSRVGRASLNKTIALPFDEAASEATFGMYSLLAKRASRLAWKDVFRRMVRELNEHLVRKGVESIGWNGIEAAWTIAIYGNDHRTRLLKEMTSFLPPYADIFEQQTLDFETT